MLTMYGIVHVRRKLSTRTDGLVSPRRGDDAPPPANRGGNEMTKEQTKTIRREPLTRGRIIEAAMRLMDTEGLEAVTMRRMGRELGVEAMSLYNHGADKEDILR